MSSTITQTEVQAVPKAPPIAIKPTEKPKHELLRSTSIEKIKRFNSFICSQNYYILPSLLTWLKTSQTVLQSTAERTIFCFKYLFVSDVLHKAIVAKTRTWVASSTDQVKTGDFLLAIEVLARSAQNRVAVAYRDISNALLRVAVYFSVVFIYLQLIFCGYLLCLTLVPSGLIFLIVCLYTVCHMHYRLNSLYVQKEELKMKEGRTNRRQSRTKEKKVLGGRTISNFNLF